MEKQLFLKLQVFPYYLFSSYYQFPIMFFIVSHHTSVVVTPQRRNVLHHTPKTPFVETVKAIHTPRGYEKVYCSQSKACEKEQDCPRLLCKTGKGNLIDFVMIKVQSLGEYLHGLISLRMQNREPLGSLTYLLRCGTEGKWPCWDWKVVCSRIPKMDSNLVL